MEWPGGGLGLSERLRPDGSPGPTHVYHVLRPQSEQIAEFVEVEDFYQGDRRPPGGDLWRIPLAEALSLDETQATLSPYPGGFGNEWDGPFASRHPPGLTPRHPLTYGPSRRSSGAWCVSRRCGLRAPHGGGGRSGFRGASSRNEENPR